MGTLTTLQDDDGRLGGAQARSIEGEKYRGPSAGMAMRSMYEARRLRQLLLLFVHESSCVPRPIDANSCSCPPQRSSTSCCVPACIQDT